MSCVGFAREWEKLGANPSFSSPQAIPTQEQYSPQEKTIDDFSLLLMKNDQKKKKNPLLTHPTNAGDAKIWI